MKWRKKGEQKKKNNRNSTYRNDIHMLYVDGGLWSAQFLLQNVKCPAYHSVENI